MALTSTPAPGDFTIGGSSLGVLPSDLRIVKRDFERVRMVGGVDRVRDVGRQFIRVRVVKGTVL